MQEKQVFSLQRGFVLPLALKSSDADYEKLAENKKEAE